jgi:hypothetical protein|tara:strand:+ start:151 stop:561 length:411 start_codon:yes stop_codon:yes gene_type:complete
MGEKPTIDNKGYIDVQSALKLKEAEGRVERARREADGRVEVDKLNAESDAKFRELLIRESAKETASKHLAKFAGLYLLILVLAFIGSIQFIPETSIAVVAGLITLVVTSLSTILRGIVENGDNKDELPTDNKGPRA